MDLTLFLPILIFVFFLILNRYIPKNAKKTSALILQEQKRMHQQHIEEMNQKQMRQDQQHVEQALEIHRQMEEAHDPYQHVGIDVTVDHSFHGINNGF